jgi:hypothetical protein
MTESRHGRLTTSEGIHITYQWSYADSTARTGASGFEAYQVGKLAYQEDNDTLWMLTATAPTWVKVGGPDSTITLEDHDHSGDTGDGGELDGSASANVANNQTTPGLPVVFVVAITGGAAADTDITIVGKHRVIDAWAQHTGGAGEASDTIQVKNGANAITDAMDWSGADNVIVRAASIDDANSEIADSGTLRVTTTDDDAGDDVGAGVVYVLAIPVA